MVGRAGRSIVIVTFASVWLLAGCTRTPSTSSRTASGATGASTTPSGSLPSVLPSGIYVDGPPGTPRYFLTITIESGGAFRGTVAFLFQDGQTAEVFTFTATTQSGVATLEASTGASITATYGKEQLTLGECTGYLPRARSLADCTFRFAPGGLG